MSVRHLRPFSLAEYTAWEQFANPVDLMVGNAAENIGQSCLRINTVELGRFDQRVGNDLVLENS